MTAPHIIDPDGLLGGALSQASPDLMRSLLHNVINALLSADADADAVRGAQQDPGRQAQRNRYRHRPLDTRVGTIDVAIPKLRSGTYFPEWLLQRRKRSETVLITVVADCCLAGVSTRRMYKLVRTLGITGLSKSQVWRVAADLDERARPVPPLPPGGAGPLTFVAAEQDRMRRTPCHLRRDRSALARGAASLCIVAYYGRPPLGGSETCSASALFSTGHGAPSLLPRHGGRRPSSPQRRSQVQPCSFGWSSG